MENASWRKFFQMKFALDKASPNALNWQKDNDVCWLYGPFFSYEPLPVIEAAALEQERASMGKDVDIGYGYGHHAMSNTAVGNYHPNITISPPHNNQSLRSALKKRKEKDDVWQALRDRYHANGGTLRPEDLQALASRDPSPPAPTGRGALFYLSDFPTRHVAREGIPRVTSETWTSAKWDRINPWDDDTNYNGNTSLNNTSNDITITDSDTGPTSSITRKLNDEPSPSAEEDAAMRGRSTRIRTPQTEISDPIDSYYNKHIRFADNVQVRVEEMVEEEEESAVDDDYSSSPAEGGAMSELSSSADSTATGSMGAAAPGTPSRVNVVALKQIDTPESETDEEPDYFVAKGSKFSTAAIDKRGALPPSPGKSSLKISNISVPLDNNNNVSSSISQSSLSSYIYNNTSINNSNTNNSTSNTDPANSLKTTTVASSLLFDNTNNNVIASNLPPLSTNPPISAVTEGTRRLLNSHNNIEDSDDEHDGVIYVNLRKSPNQNSLPQPSETPSIPAGPAVPAAMKYANSSTSLGGLKRTTSTGKLSLALQQATQVQQERLASAPAQYANLSFTDLLPAPPGSSMSMFVDNSPPTSPTGESVVDLNPVLSTNWKYSSEETGQEPQINRNSISNVINSSSSSNVIPSPPPSASSENVLLLGVSPTSPTASVISSTNMINATEGPDTDIAEQLPEEQYTVNDRVNDVVNNAYEVMRWAGAALSNLGLF